MPAGVRIHRRLMGLDVPALEAGDVLEPAAEPVRASGI
jgi:hypothetical protein